LFDFFSRHLVLDFKWFDLLDIAIVYYVLYKMLILIKGTRAVQMLTGLFLIGLLYISSMILGLFTVHEILSRFFSYLFIIIIIVFQDDIRKVLARMGSNYLFGIIPSQKENEKLIEEVVKSAIALARRKVGALIVIEQTMGLKDSIEVGIKLDSEVKAELLISIFNNSSPIHDGAVIIKDNRMVSAGCFLPLSRNPNIDKALGARHRAALGISEVTDVLVVVVSEEKKEISFVKEGEILRGLDGPGLRKVLQSSLFVEGIVNE
jgi:diadenylate cyclase